MLKASTAYLINQCQTRRGFILTNNCSIPCTLWHVVKYILYSYVIQPTKNAGQVRRILRTFDFPVRNTLALKWNRQCQAFSVGSVKIFTTVTRYSSTSPKSVSSILKDSFYTFSISSVEDAFQRLKNSYLHLGMQLARLAPPHARFESFASCPSLSLKPFTYSTMLFPQLDDP